MLRVGTAAWLRRIAAILELWTVVLPPRVTLVLRAETLWSLLMTLAVRLVFFMTQLDRRVFTR